MAASDVEAQLKHLSFVKMAAIKAAVVVSNLYAYAKDNSGPLKSTLGKVEHAVTAALAPACSKYKDVPNHILLFIDQKVDDASYVFDKHAPATAKLVVSKTQSMMKTASELVQEARVEGPAAAISRAGKISKEFTATQLAVMWHKANQYSLLHGILEKYNSLVKGLMAKGWCSYVPLVPVEGMNKSDSDKE